MSLLRLSVPTVFVDNVPYPIVPGSFGYKPGLPKAKVDSSSLGGGAAISVHSIDATSLVGYCEFEMETTEMAKAAANLWTNPAQIGQHVIQAAQLNMSPITCSGASVSNEIEFKDKVKFEFSGDPMPKAV
jgi:hypothetical protein